MTKGVYKKLDKYFTAIGILCTSIGLIVLAVLIIDVFLDGRSRLTLGFLLNV